MGWCDDPESKLIINSSKLTNIQNNKYEKYV